MTRGQMLEGFRTVGAGEAAALELLESIPADDDTPLLQCGSCLIGPDGNLLTQSDAGDDATVYAEVDPAAAEEGRMYLDTDSHYSRPDVFSLRVDTRPQKNVEIGPVAMEDVDR